MSLSPDAERSGPADAADEPLSAAAHEGLWHRIHEHKILQWTLGYLGAALALAHGAELLGHTFHWPEIAQRLIMGVLIVGLPLVLTLAWYHGHKGLKSVSHGELMIASILLVIGAGLLIVLVRSPSENAEAPVAVTAGAVPLATISTTTLAAPRTSIAVMPFANLTGDATKDYLGDGMSEELINVLTKVPGLTVPSRTSSFAYKGRNTDLKQIAKDLSVGTILEGSVRSAGTTIRVTAQLIDAQSDRHLWSETYDRKFTDLFKLQDDLAKAIVQALQVNLHGASTASVTQAPPSQDVEAYQLYLQGRSLGESGMEQGLRDAMALYKRALALDPKFARALAALAQLRLTYLVLGYPLPNALEDAEREAAQALELDPSLADAHAVHGAISAYRGNWLEAEAGFRAALSSSVGDTSIREYYSTLVLDSAGHMQQALAQRREAYRLAPASTYAVTMLAAGYSLIGRDDDALQYADLAMKLGARSDVVPMPQIYAHAHDRSGRYAEAADRIVVTLPASLRAGGGEAVIRGVYAALGDPVKKPAARDALQKLLHTLKADDLNVTTQKDMIVLFTQLGAVDRAFELANQSLDQFARTGTVGSAWGVLWLPQMRSFRQDLRFQGLVTRLNLIDYWKQYGPPDDCDLKDGKLICR